MGQFDQRMQAIQYFPSDGVVHEAITFLEEWDIQDSRSA